MALGVETGARPYAKAAFQFALEKGEIERWAAWLHYFSTIVNDTQVKEYISDPTIAAARRLQLLKEINKALPQVSGGDHFLAILAKKWRLNLIPAIASLFEKMKQAQKEQCLVGLVSAWALEDQQKAQLKQSLCDYLKQTVILHCTVDQSLLGGLIIRLGDTVIDHSVRGYFTRLKAQFD